VSDGAVLGTLTIPIDAAVFARRCREAKFKLTLAAAYLDNAAAAPFLSKSPQKDLTEAVVLLNEALHLFGGKIESMRGIGSAPPEDPRHG